jgi:hypothetical protein
VINSIAATAEAAGFSVGGDDRRGLVDRIARFGDEVVTRSPCVLDTSSPL